MSKKAMKLVPAKPTEEMLKAMDECSKKGYDERLYAGHAASVYMAAVDAAPTTPAQRTWVGLNDDELADFWFKQSLDWMEFARVIEDALRSKNT